MIFPTFLRQAVQVLPARPVLQVQAVFLLINILKKRGYNFKTILKQAAHYIWAACPRYERGEKNEQGDPNKKEQIIHGMVQQLVVAWKYKRQSYP